MILRAAFYLSNVWFLSEETAALPPAALARLWIIAITLGRGCRSDNRLGGGDIVATVGACRLCVLRCLSQICRGFTNLFEGNICDRFFNNHRLDGFNLHLGRFFSLRSLSVFSRGFFLCLGLAGAAWLLGLRCFGNHVVATTFNHAGGGFDDNDFGFGSYDFDRLGIICASLIIAFAISLTRYLETVLFIRAIAATTALATTAALATAFFIG